MIMRRIDENGFMHTEHSNISKAQVRPYRGEEITPIAGAAGIKVDPEQIYGLFCPEEALADSVDLWNGLDLMFEHHYTNAENPVKDYVIGSVHDAVFEAPYLKARLTIKDKEPQDLLERGEYEELSCSYKFDLVNESGTFNSEPYNFKMANIRPNHVAMVEKGRAGKECCVADENKINEEGKVMNILDQILALIQGEKGGKTAPAADEQQEAAPPVAKIPAGNEGDEKKTTTDNQDEVAAIIEAVAAINPELAEKLKAALATPAVGDEEAEKVDDEDDEKDKPPVVADAALIERKAVNKIKGLCQAAKKVKYIVGDVDPFAYETPEDIYAQALEAKGLNPKNYDRRAWAGMVDVYAVHDSAMKMPPAPMAPEKYTGDFEFFNK